MADLEQQSAVTALAIGCQGDFAGAFDDISKELYCLGKQHPIFFPATQCPDKPTGPLHQHDRPTFAVFHRHSPAHLGV